MFHNGFSLSVEKTVFVMFGPWHPASPEFSIIINGQRLYAAKQVKYLGVTFHWSGSVSKHVHSNIQSALRATNLVELLSRIPWANQPKTMITLVKSLVRSRLYYGLEACYDMPASLITAIERAECRTIKLALGLPRATPRYLAYREAGMLPAKLYLQFICSKYQFRSQTPDNSTGVEVLRDFGGPATARFCVPFRDFTRAVWKLCGEEFAAKARDSGYTNDLSPPRCQCTSPQLCTVCVLTCGEPSSSPNCVCAGRWSRPTTLFLSVLHWRVTLNLLLISFDCLIRRRTSPVCVVSVTTRAGDWRWTQPS